MTIQDNWRSDGEFGLPIEHRQSSAVDATTSEPIDHAPRAAELDATAFGRALLEDAMGVTNVQQCDEPAHMLEHLRLFCALSMDAQDWQEAEVLFNALKLSLTKQVSELEAGHEEFADARKISYLERAERRGELLRRVLGHVIPSTLRDDIIEELKS